MHDDVLIMHDHVLMHPDPDTHGTMHGGHDQYLQLHAKLRARVRTTHAHRINAMFVPAYGRGLAMSVLCVNRLCARSTRSHRARCHEPCREPPLQGPGRRRH